MQRIMCKSKIHRASITQADQIPFENIDIILNKNVSLEIKNKIFEKIIKNKRGCCCFELNGLFACLLQNT